jgi:hypothetical protein
LPEGQAMSQFLLRSIQIWLQKLVAPLSKHQQLNARLQNWHCFILYAISGLFPDRMYQKN